MNNIKTEGREQLLYSICSAFMSDNFDADTSSDIRRIVMRLKKGNTLSIDDPKRELRKTKEPGKQSEYEYTSRLVRDVISCFGIGEFRNFYLPQSFLSINCKGCYDSKIIDEEYWDWESGGKKKTRSKRICTNIHNCKINKVHKIIGIARKINRVASMADAYVDIFIYSECSVELFNQILALYNYGSRTSRAYLQCKRVVSACIENEILEMHGKLIFSLIQKYKIWKHQLGQVCQ